jgi:hypothetical protein
MIEMKTLAHLLLIANILLTGCNGSGAAQGGGSENGAYGHVKVGMPF